MTKKLFVVLVVVLAMIVAVSWAIAAKKAVVGYPEKVEMPKFTDQQGASAMPKGIMVEKEDAVLIKGTKQSAAYTAAGPLTGSLNRAGGKDFCDLYGSAAFAITDWFWGMEWYANYQDPEEFGCVAVWPFQVVDVGFNIMVDYAQDIDVQGFVYSADLTDPDCPVPGMELCATPVYTFSIPDAGHWVLGMPMVDECCVYEPYFAVIYIVTDLQGTGADAVSEDMVPCLCRSYNDYGAGWDDLCAEGNDWPGPMMLWSDGYTSPQNDCPGEEPDTCYVTLVDPPVVEVLAGGTAQFTATVVLSGDQTECLLTVVPDPACPSCVTTITPNPATDFATITIVTDPTTPPGDYVFDVNGSKASATVRVLEPSTECELKRDNGSAASYFGSWDVGDQNATYMDPEEICVGCGPDVYPFKINKVTACVYDHAGLGLPLDVTVHFYAVGVLCDGPGAAFYSYGPVTVDVFYPDGWAEIVLPDEPCVEGPFFLAIEYGSGDVGTIPSVLFDNNAPVDTCYQWNDYLTEGWIEWWDFWATPADVGWLMIRAEGNCDAACPAECYLIQDEGVVASYFSGLGPGDILAKYFDPELYCEDPVYPLNVHDVDMLFYDFAGVGTVDIRVNVYMVCHDTCDGPGTHIYRSDPITITTFYPDMAHIVLEDLVCVNGPFFIGIEWVSGEPGSTPSQLMQGDDMPCDSCHAFMYYPTGGADFWIEWYDFWTPPPPGCPILRVSAATNHPDCVQDPCDTPLELLWGGLYAYYFWKQPPNGEFINMQFTMPLTNPGRLDAVEIAWYASGTIGTPDPDVYVWLSDGNFPLDNNPPYQALAEFHVLNDDLVFYPTYYYIDCHELGLMFDVGEKFHVGGSHAHEADDTLSWLSDDGAFESERGSEWDGSAWSSFYPYEFLINAYVCLYEPPESTFTLECSPYLASVTPGDPPAAKFVVDLGAILGYNLNVALSCAPPAGFTVSFDPPNGVPPFASDVYVSVDAGTPYDDYTLTFCGTGDDGQIICCDVKARVEPPYDEAEVDFYHGMQRASNFGAVGNDVRDNFVWYGISALFDGSFIVATDNPVNMALDIYNCAHWGWVPSQHIDCYYDAEYNANICYGNFYCDELEPGIPGVPGEHDSVFIVGIMDECIDFSIKIKVYYNDGPDPITGMYLSLFEDWDVGDAYNNAGNLDPDHNIAYMYDPLDPDLVFGTMKAPYYDDPLFNSYIIPNYQYVWPNEGFCDDLEGWWGLDSLYWLMTQPGHFYQTGPDSDFSILQTAGPIDLPVGEKHIEVWIDFGRNLMDGTSWNQWWHRVLRYAGFYRGDCNASDTLELPALDVSDLVYLIQYLFQAGPPPLPYADQGDVDGSGCGGGEAVNVGDVVYLLNYIFLDGPPPVDYMRFIPQCWPRESLFLNNNWD